MCKNEEKRTWVSHDMYTKQDMRSKLKEDWTELVNEFGALLS